MNKQLYILIISSILFLIGVFSMNWKVMGLLTLQYTIVILSNIFWLLNKNNMNVDFVANKLMTDGINYFKNKKYVQGVVYSLAFPMMSIGIIMVGLIIICMLFLF